MVKYPVSLELRVQNFQSIEDSAVEIKGFTALVGDSNRGKSAMLRALRAVCQNEFPLSYIRVGAKEAVLTLQLKYAVETPTEDSSIASIVFRRSAKVNEYTVTTVGGDIQVYSKVGSGVLDFLKELGFDVLVTDRKDVIDVVFQEQLKPLFLIGESPVYVTSFLNEVFQISKYEGALRSASRDLVVCTKEYNEGVERLDTASRDLHDVSTQVQAKRDKVQDYAKAQGILSASLAHYQAVLQARKDRDTQVEIESQVRVLEERLSKDRKYSAMLLQADILLRKQQYLATQKDSLLCLEKERVPLTRVLAGVKAYIEVLNTLLFIFKMREGLLRLKNSYVQIEQESTQVKSRVDSFRKLSSALYAIQQVQEERVRLEKMCSESQALDSSLRGSIEKVQELKSVQGRLRGYESALKEKLGACPLCGGELKEKEGVVSCGN